PARRESRGRPAPGRRSRTVARVSRQKYVLDAGLAQRGSVLRRTWRGGARAGGRIVANPGRIGDAPGVRRIARAPSVQLPEVTVAVRGGDDAALVEHEWLVTNGIGGYSSGTVAGVITRRYHGLLVAALANPLGRTVMLNAIDDELTPGQLEAFTLEGGVPTWRYRAA